MQISECMSTDIRIVSPQDTLQHAARIMSEIDAGFLPVGEDDRLVGMLTDRDIAIRGVGAGGGAQSRVEEAMTREVHYCFEDEDEEDAFNVMADLQVRRLPVLSRDKRLVGIVSLGDIARDDNTYAGAALASISRDTGIHSQSVDGH